MRDHRYLCTANNSIRYAKKHPAGYRPLSQIRPADRRRRAAPAHRPAVQRTDDRHGIRIRRMVRNLPPGRRERPLRRDRGIRLPVALHDEHLADEIHPSVGIYHAGRTHRSILLRGVLQYDLRRIRQRRAPNRNGRTGLLGRLVRPAALPARNPEPLDNGMVRADRRPLRGTHDIQRRERVLLLERVRRTLQLHRRGLPGLYERGGGQHHGVLPHRADGAGNRARDARGHVVSLPARHRARRQPHGLEVEGRGRSRLPRRAGGRRRAAPLQHPFT